VPAARVESRVKTKTTSAASIHKVRRDVVGGKRGQGHEWQQAGRKIRRPDPAVISAGEPDDTLTGMGGLVAFGRFTRCLGLERELRERFGGLKEGRGVVYPMGDQLRLLLDVAVVGEDRLFALEALSSDRLFVHLAGGMIPSLDTVYRDLRRFESTSLTSFEQLMAQHGLSSLALSPSHVHLDIDTTVEELFGSQEGALPGPNPRYHGRNSYHPALGVIAETGSCVGAELRHGDRGFGEADVPVVMQWIKRLRAKVGPATLITARMDAAGDCTELLENLDASGTRFIIKLKWNAKLLGHALVHDQWRITGRDAFNHPTERVAVLPFKRAEWKRCSMPYRVIALRSTERRSGQQLRIWDEPDESVQFYVTNDWLTPPEEIPTEYDGRAEVETVIRDLKGGLGIGKVPSESFDANHAMFLLKLLAHNLLRRFAVESAPRIAHWRTPWLRRVLVLRPGRLLRSGRQWTLRSAPTSPLLE
jgi:hypothetical protein